MTVSVGAARAKSYFRDALTTGDYYGFKNLEQEIVGAWGGKGAQRLGLDGVATRETFERLCDNLHPLTGERLTPRFKEDRRVGYDIKFHVPKSVSVMLELGGDTRIPVSTHFPAIDGSLEILVELLIPLFHAIRHGVISEPRRRLRWRGPFEQLRTTLARNIEHRHDREVTAPSLGAPGSRVIAYGRRHAWELASH